MSNTNHSLTRGSIAAKAAALLTARRHSVSPDSR